MTALTENRQRARAILERGAKRAYRHISAPVSPVDTAVVEVVPAAPPIVLPPLPSEQVSGRSIDDILRTQGPAAPVVPAPAVPSPQWGWARIAFGFITLIGAVFAAFYILGHLTADPVVTVQGTAVPISDVTIQPTASAPNSRTPLAARYPIGAEAQTTTGPVTDTNQVTYQGATLMKTGNNEYGMEVEDLNTCVPAFWSPAPSWGGWESQQSKFISERTGCFTFPPTDQPIPVLGWYGDTTWVYVHQKSGTVENNVWLDVQWIGRTIAEAKQIPGTKDYAQTPAAPATTTPSAIVPPVNQEAAPAQSYVPPPPPPPPATLAPPTPAPTDKPLTPAMRPAFADDEDTLVPTNETGSAPAKPKPTRSLPDLPTPLLNNCQECHH